MKLFSGIFITSLVLGTTAFLGCATQDQRDQNTQAQEKPKSDPEQQLKVGMTKAEVEKLFGKPGNVASSSDGSEVWQYNDTAKAFIPFYAIGGGKFKNIMVTFDADGKVRSWTTGSHSIY
jgi:outer membrane protein assembly factor BamE (lipoprotein component of BamABCDE complex)